jgi:hypothetical protein
MAPNVSCPAAEEVLDVITIYGLSPIIAEFMAYRG